MERCPVCGGEVSRTLGSTWASCPYCLSPLLVEEGAVMARYAVRPSLDPAAALRALLRWMSGSEPVVGLPGAAIGTPRLEWLPVWFARTRGKGGERTHERRADDAP